MSGDIGSGVIPSKFDNNRTSIFRLLALIRINLCYVVRLYKIRSLEIV